MLELAGEPPYPVDPAAEDPARRADQLAADGLDRALVALSSVLGIEALPPDEARRLIDAHEQGLAELPDVFGWWGSVPLAEPDPDDVDAALDRGATGLVLPAGALSSPAALDRAGPLLERLERRGAPLFVHPGPAQVPEGAPAWWPALTGYLAETSAAWHAFAEAGRRAHPSLRVVFAVLAGGAPLHAERLGARGGPAERVRDEGLFYDVSSYGPRALEAVGAAVGPRQLAFGSDRPVIEPPLAIGVFEQVSGTSAYPLFIDPGGSE